jgi:hypothetical protein
MSTSGQERLKQRRSACGRGSERTENGPWAKFESRNRELRATDAISRSSGHSDRPATLSDSYRASAFASADRSSIDRSRGDGPPLIAQRFRLTSSSRISGIAKPIPYTACKVAFSVSCLAGGLRHEQVTVIPFSGKFKLKFAQSIRDSFYS